jgi:mono/diheme cytochrome c family protein
MAGWLVGSLMGALVLGEFVVASPARRAVKEEASKAAAAKVERGRYLVHAMGCHDCHTPKKMGPNGPELDLSRALSGHPESPELPAPPRLPNGPWAATASWDLTAWSGPWGISYPFNLTPDENTGLGIWTEEMFVKAMRTGRHMGTSRPILPPMPWWTLGALNDEDLTSVFAYLRSLPPIKNRVPAPVIAEPVVADAR